MIYLSFTDRYSGVYQSQVIDVARYLHSRFSIRLRVVAIVSLRNFFRERSRFRSAFPGILVVPMVPGVRNWRLNALPLALITLVLGERALIGRSEFATGIGLLLRRMGIVDQVVFDGRSARAAEVREYQSPPERAFPPEDVEKWEREAVQRSDFRMAVSSRLVDYWREHLDYSGEEHVVIPCTLPLSEGDHPSPSSPTRSSLGFETDQTVIAFSGGASGWQSFRLMDRFLCRVLDADPQVAVLLLSNAPIENLETYRRFSLRIVQKWVSPRLVQDHLSACDYGLLLREDTLTNRVACPTKFAEYLSAGLDVLISPDLGDLSEFVRRHDCGIPIDPDATPPHLKPNTPQHRARNRDLAKTHFEKDAHASAYERMLRRVGMGESSILRETDPR